MAEVVDRKDARVTARVPQQVLDTLQHAAELTGATVNQFVVQAAMKEAEEVIERERFIAMTQRDAEFFCKTLDNPPPLNDRLKAAAARYRDTFNAENNTFNWEPR